MAKTEEVKANKQNLVNKISTAKIIGKVEKPTESKLLYTVFGIVSDYSMGESQHGTYTEFKGNFEAITADGETFRSGKCFIPEVGTDLIRGAIDKAKQAEDFAGLEFAFEIGVKPATNPIGYEYIVKPIVESQQNDPLSDLRSKALPAPAK